MNGRSERGRISSERSKREYDLSKIMRVLFPKAAFLLCGYFAGLCELPFGARPFGMALVSASGEGALTALIGACIASVVALDGFEAALYVGAYILIFAVKMIWRLFEEGKAGNVGSTLAQRVIFGKFCEPVGLRIIFAALFAAIVGAIRLFAGGMLYYDLFGFLLSALLSPLATFVICGYTVKTRGKMTEARALYSDVGVLMLCAICVFGAREVNIYGASLSAVIALMATFYISHTRGIAHGTVAGLALGLCYSPMLSPLFVIGALCIGVFARFSVSLACFASLFACSAWAFYIEGISALSGTFGGVISACLVYSALDKTVLNSVVRKNDKITPSANSENDTAGVECTVLSRSALDSVRLRDLNMRRKAVSDGLLKISALLDDMKGQRYKGYSSSKMCDEKYNKSFVGEQGAIDYKTFSALLSEFTKCEENEYKIDPELSQRLCLVLSTLNFKICGVLVYGVRKKTIYIKGVDYAILKSRAREIAEAVAPHLPFLIDFSKLEVYSDGDSGGCLLLCERDKILASVVRRRVVAKNESVCGDSVTVFKNNDGRFFALISDGMGTGSEASAVSQMAIAFLCNMLTVGGLSEELILMLNSFLRGASNEKCAECSATLDLLELDLMNGRASFYKCGAAASYIYRKGRLFKLRAESMPIGILPDVDLKKNDFELRRGDVVVMVSDGVTGEGEECPWLFDLLAQSLPSRSPDRIAELIVKYASAQGSTDDISVLVVSLC